MYKHYDVTRTRIGRFAHAFPAMK